MPARRRALIHEILHMNLYGTKGERKVCGCKSLAGRGLILWCKSVNTN